MIRKGTRSLFRTLSIWGMLLLFCTVHFNAQAQNNFIIGVQSGLSFGNKITTDAWWIGRTKPSISSIFSLNILKNTKQVMWGIGAEMSSLNSQSRDSLNPAQTIKYHKPSFSIYAKSYYKRLFKKGMFLIGGTVGYSSVKIVDIAENLLKSEGIILGINIAYSYPFKKMNLIVECSPKKYEMSVYNYNNLLQEQYSVESLPISIGLQIPFLTNYFAHKKVKKEEDDE